jgi:tight adherence protein B
MEYTLFIFALISFLVYLRKTAIPWFTSRFERAATSASTTLREDFLFLSRAQASLGLLLLFLLPGTATVIIFRNGWVGFLVGVSCGLLSGGILRTYRNRRRKKIAEQLPSMLDILAGHLQAGHSLAEALKNSVALLPRGIREEVSWIFQRVQIGTPLSESLTLWESRIPIEEVLLVVRPLKSALSTGSDVANLLARCRDILQAKQTMEGRLRSMTAQARLQAIVLTLLPPGFILLLSKIDPAYLPRCLGTGPGVALLSIAAALQMAGWLCIRKIMAEKP